MARWHLLDLGPAFATERNAQLDADCGSIDNVRRIVAAAAKDGPLDDEDDEDWAGRLGWT